LARPTSDIGATAFSEGPVAAFRTPTGPHRFNTSRRREQFPLGTPTKAAAAAKARDIYVGLQGGGWENTLALYKPKSEEAKPEKSCVGDLIREVTALTSYRSTTLSVYCGALRRIAGDIARIEGTKSRFAPNGPGNTAWRQQVDATPLDSLTAGAIQQWKLDHLKEHKNAKHFLHRHPSRR
jgi:hypothetical protein